MKIIRASLADQKPWRAIDAAIRRNMTPEMISAWANNGYEGLMPLVPSHFGMMEMYRDHEDNVTYIFTDEQWTWFSLKWL